MTTHTDISIAIKLLKHFFEHCLSYYFIDSRQFLFAPVLSPAVRDNFMLSAALICNRGQRTCMQMYVLFWKSIDCLHDALLMKP